MRTSWNYLLALTLSATLLACGDDGNTIGEDRGDADIPDVDSGVTWTLGSASIRTIAPLDPAVVNPERTTRVLVTIELAGCEDLAMPSFTWNEGAREVTVDMRVWQPLNTACTGETTVVTRPVALKLPATGTWNVISASGGDPVTIDVADAPARACDPNLTVNCGMDCDCPAGQACLGANGFAGPFTQCAQPCEVNRDCNGNGRCVIIVGDSLSYFCDDTVPECDDQNLCPTNFSCASGTCEPDFVLGPDTRVACAGDQDCTAPLRCVEGTLADRAPQCELACPTEGTAWCSDQHTCGTADQDATGTAPSDSVCVGQ